MRTESPPPANDDANSGDAITNDALASGGDDVSGGLRSADPDAGGVPRVASVEVATEDATPTMMDTTAARSMGDRLESVTRALAEFDLMAAKRGRAAAPATGLGRLFRKLVGVDEELMDAFPAERAKYTAMGGFIVGTAALASISMWFAIYDGLRAPIPVAILVALVWGFFIGNMDRWLVTSLSKPGWTRFAIVFPRLAFAILFAVIIAEPLTLRIFDREVQNKLAQSWDSDFREYQTLVLKCNPKVPRTSSETPPPECAGKVLEIPGAPSATIQRVQSYQQQLETAKATLASDLSELAKKNDLARRECNGARGDGLSGVVGQGPNCLRDRQEADTFAATVDIKGQQETVTKLEGLIREETTLSGPALEAYGQNAQAAIDAALAKFKDNQGAPGLSDKIGTLASIASSNAVVGWATILVRLLFIVIECMPILIKLLSGRGPYERAVHERMELSGRLERERNLAEEAVASLGPRVKVMQTDSDLRTAELDQQAQERFEAAKRRERVLAEIRAYRNRLLATGTDEASDVVDLREMRVNGHPYARVRQSAEFEGTIGSTPAQPAGPPGPA